MTALVIVDEVHPARGANGANGANGAGVVVSPRIVVHEASGPPFAVRLELPDGTFRDAKAALDVAHIRGPNGAFALVRLPGLTVEDVPRGTIVRRI